MNTNSKKVIFFCLLRKNYIKRYTEKPETGTDGGAKPKMRRKQR